MPRGRAGDTPGKLKAVARAWASGRGGARTISDDAATRHAILPEWLTKRTEPEQVEIGAADEDVVSLFFMLDTQWRCHPMSGSRIGIDYAAIAPTAALMGIAMTPAMMIDLRAMELGALEEIAKRASK